MLRYGTRIKLHNLLLNSSWLDLCSADPVQPLTKAGEGLLQMIYLVQ